jgi:hypothetical protein
MADTTQVPVFKAVERHMAAPSNFAEHVVTTNDHHAGCILAIVKAIMAP